MSLGIPTFRVPRRRPLGRASALACLCVALGPGLTTALAGEVSRVDVSTGATGTRAEIQLQGKGEFKTLALHGPERLVVDLPASSAARGLKLPAGSGIVSSVRTGQPNPGTLRIVFDLASPISALKPRVESTASGARLVIEWPGDGPAPAASVAARPAAPSSTTPSSNSPTSTASAAGTMPSTNGSTAADPASAARATAALTAQVVQQARQPAATSASTSSPATTTPTTTPPSTTIATTTGSATAPATSAPSTSSNGATALAILNGQPTAATAPATPGSSGVTPAGVPYTVATGKPAEAAPTANEFTARATPQSMQPGMRPLIVAIDPGHGGQDSGAVGQDGTYEKNVVLAIARELARQINATPGMKAYLTRDSDVFIPLELRARKARSADADMFVSIHADAAENRNARGSSVYVLSLKGASSQRARWLADKENASDMIGGVPLQKVDNTLSSVLLDLAQSGHMRASEDAANHVLDGLKRVGNNHKPNIERANFAVLRTSDMPAMLVETAFISNPEEERRLKDPSYQRKVAAAVLDGVNTYFTRQPPPGTLFAARARAEAEASRAVASGGAP